MKSLVFLVVFGCLIGQILALWRPEPYVTHKITKSNQEVEVKSNTEIVLQFNNFFEKRVKYEFSNKRDIDNSKFVDYIGETKSACEDSEETCFDDNTYYSFRINDITGRKKLIPQLQFIYYFMDDETHREVRRTIYVNLVEENETLNSLEQLTVKPDVNISEHFYEVDSNTILNVQFDMDRSIPASGYNWYIDNKSEIKEWVEYIGDDYEDVCDIIEINRADPDCNDGVVTFKFLVKDIKYKLPKIHFELRLVYAEGTLHVLNVNLKPKSEPTPECPKNGYPCCSKVNTKIRYTDDDGEWGIEHGEWCFIVKKDPCYPFGYKCCDSSTRDVVYKDRDGEWGIEDGEWCYFFY